jgi:hypothetical protein
MSMDRDQPRHTIRSNLGPASGTGTLSAGLGPVSGIGTREAQSLLFLATHPSHFPAKFRTKVRRRGKFTIPHIPTPQSLQIGTRQPQSTPFVAQLPIRSCPRSISTLPFLCLHPVSSHAPSAPPIRPIRDFAGSKPKRGTSVGVDRSLCVNEPGGTCSSLSSVLPPVLPLPPIL